MLIRPLHPDADSAAVADLFRRAADYVLLESGHAPGQAEIDDFFTGAPPAIDPATSLRLGLSLTASQLVAIADVAFGFPNADDAYIGLLLIDPDHRGKRLGQDMLSHILAAAKARGATRMLIAVLEANPKGRRFWERMGFVEEIRGPATRIGNKTHIRIRMARPI